MPALEPVNTSSSGFSLSISINYGFTVNCFSVLSQHAFLPNQFKLGLLENDFSFGSSAFVVHNHYQVSTLLNDYQKSQGAYHFWAKENLERQFESLRWLHQLA